MKKTLRNVIRLERSSFFHENRTLDHEPDTVPHTISVRTKCFSVSCLKSPHNPLHDHLTFLYLGLTHVLRRHGFVG
ncbi:hypothetical protein OAF65_05245 [Verrucomicrobiales bacterium]|nr:hypothetical protein [Verrucomicrobiales bacterium]